MTPSRLESLRSLAAVLWESIADADPEKRAPLAAQYRATLAEVAELERESGKVADPVDEITARRAARGAGSAARTRRTATDSG